MCQRGSDCEVVGKAEQGRIAKERTREFEAVGQLGEANEAAGRAGLGLTGEGIRAGQEATLQICW